MESLDCFVCLMLVSLQWTPAPATKNITWTYKGLVGQSEWSEHFPDCGGTSQSPVDIVTTHTKYDPALLPLTPLGYSQHGNKPFTLYNNGHTGNYGSSLAPNSIDSQWWLSCQSGWDWGGCPGSTQLHKCIFTGAAVARATGALHVVHYNSELYPSVSTAMTQRDGLAVLGVLIVTGEETNVAFNNILNYLSRVRHADQKVSIPAFDIQSLLPTDLGSYYRYNGSLTTPPCYQSVAWIVFNERVQISKAQLLKMETLLYSTKAEDEFRILLQDNYRVTQPLNHRVVFTSFSAESGKELSSGEVTAIVIGVMCGCVGLAVIVRFVVKTIRSTSSWDVLPSNRPAPMPRINEPKKANDKKQDVALNLTSDSEKKEEPLPPPQTEP